MKNKNLVRVLLASLPLLGTVSSLRAACLTAAVTALSYYLTLAWIRAAGKSPSKSLFEASVFMFVLVLGVAAFYFLEAVPYFVISVILLCWEDPRVHYGSPSRSNAEALMRASELPLKTVLVRGLGLGALLIYLGTAHEILAVRFSAAFFEQPAGTLLLTAFAVLIIQAWPPSLAILKGGRDDL